MKKEFVFGLNINGSGQDGVIEITQNGMTIFCLCNEDAGKVIVAALNNMNFTPKAIIDMVIGKKDDSGLRGHTYGDTCYDSMSVVYGHNKAIDCIVDEIYKFGK